MIKKLFIVGYTTVTICGAIWAVYFTKELLIGNVRVCESPIGGSRGE